MSAMPVAACSQPSLRLRTLVVLPARGQVLQVRGHFMEDGRIHVRFGKISAANGPPTLYDVHMDEHTEWLPPPGSTCAMIGVFVHDTDRHYTLKLGPMFAVNVLNLLVHYYDQSGRLHTNTMDKRWEGVLVAVYVPNSLMSRPTAIDRALHAACSQLIAPGMRLAASCTD